MFQNIWSGVGIPSTNMMWTEVFVPESAWVILSETPTLVTRIVLPLVTHGVCLYSSTDEVWYTQGSLGVTEIPPGPIPAPIQGTQLGEHIFVPGGVLRPGAWQLFSLPDDGLQHVLMLVSNASSPAVLVTALTEAV